MRSSTIVLAALAPAAALVAPAAPLGRVASGRAAGRAAVSMNQRYDDPILNDNIPDPLYDEPSPYKGRVPYGFSEFAEKMNGRAAMMGFVILFLQEAIVGKGVLEQYGAGRAHARPRTAPHR